MPTGPVPLVEAVKAGSDVLKAGVVETLTQTSPMLETLPIKSFQGNALKHQVEGTLPDVQFRPVNSTYTRSWGSDLEHFWGVSILGGEVFVDNFIVNTMGNVYSEKAKQFTKFAKSLSMTFDKNVFDGDGLNNTFKGINALVAEGFGLKYRSNADNVNGGALTLDDLDVALDLITGGEPDMILSNKWFRRKLKKLAMTAVSGTVLIDVGTDSFGRRVTMYNDIPIRIIDEDKDGNQILGFDETEGATSNTASIYIVRLGEDNGLTALMGAGSYFEVRDFGETEAAPGHLGRIECYPGIAIFDPTSVVRLSGITNA